MMDDIRINITGDRQAGLRFETFPDAIYDDLRTEIDALGSELLALVQAATPDRTGALRSQERLRLFADKTRITSYVDVAGASGSQDFAKAAALEYGAHGSVKVSEHMMRLDHHWAEALDKPQMVLVEAYTRAANIAERAFERGPLAGMQPEILARLNAVVERQVARANA